jgi:hypothetical protein
MTEIGQRASNLTIYIKRGSDWTTTFTIFNPDDSPVDLSGSSFAGQIRKVRLAEEIVASFIFSINELTNEVTVSLPKSVNNSIPCGENEDSRLSKYVYDFEWTRSDGSVDRFQEGPLIISADVTR